MNYCNRIFERVLTPGTQITISLVRERRQILELMATIMPSMPLVGATLVSSRVRSQQNCYMHYENRRSCARPRSFVRTRRTIVEKKNVLIRSRDDAARATVRRIELGALLRRYHERTPG